MANDFTMELLNSVLQQRVEELRADGLSDSEIIDKISELKIENALMEVVSRFGGSAGNRTEMKKRVIDGLLAYFEKYLDLVWGK